MGRTAGATNKNKPESNEAIFLTDVLTKYNFWSAEAERMKDAGKDAKMELQYAEAYRLLLNKFTEINK